MEFIPLTQDGKLYCKACSARSERKFSGEMAQSTFVATCERGHLQDFPYREWVHRLHNPTCCGELYFTRSGSGTLAGQKIRCSCGASRTLLNADKANYSDTYLSFCLSKKDGIFFCQGHRPWVGETVHSECPAYLRGNPRNANNVHFSQTASSIYLPKAGEARAVELKMFLARPDVAPAVKAVSELELDKSPAILKIMYPKPIGKFTDAEIKVALAESISGASNSVPAEISNKVDKKDLSEAEFRHPEYTVLRESQNEETLITRRVDLTAANPKLATFFSSLVQVDRLRETRAFTGFSRIYSNNILPLEERKVMLRATAPGENLSAASEDEDSVTPDTDWLPAITVFGEGIFLELNAERVSQWINLNGSALRLHLMPLQSSIRKGKKSDGTAEKPEQSILSPTFLLLHTLSHLLIHQLTFECGYSAAALRERIYFSEDKSIPMLGILIYTADGDSEGTLGGLVHLGTPEKLEQMLKRALLSARRCAQDPFCSETGSVAGQGPDNCNLAACHACALLPETACEQFNKFLDRSLLVNLHGSKIVGFFESF